MKTYYVSRLPRLGLQAGGTFAGVIVGLVVGLGIALGVALYITKAPINFAQKNQNRTSEQDAQEAKKNRDWDPNVSLQGKNPVKPVPATSSPSTASTPSSTPTGAAAESANSTTSKPAKAADPLGDLAKAKSDKSAPLTAASSDPFVYFVQSGAYRAAAEAEAQRAKLAMLGFDAKVTEREQSGYTVFRVRVGPIDKKEDADKLKERIESSGIESVVIRVNR